MELQERTRSVVAVHLEQDTTEHWVPDLQRQTSTRYPKSRLLLQYQNAHMAILQLHSSLPWTAEDEEFFEQLKARKVVQRWEPLYAVVPAHAMTSESTDDLRTDRGLTPEQQEALLRRRIHDLEQRAIAAERALEAQHDYELALARLSQQYHARQGMVETVADLYDNAFTRISQRSHALLDMLETLNDALGIVIDGDFIDGPCTVKDRGTGQIIAREVSLREVYPSLLQRR